MNIEGQLIYKSGGLGVKGNEVLRRAENVMLGAALLGTLVTSTIIVLFVVRSDFENPA